MQHPTSKTVVPLQEPGKRNPHFLEVVLALLAFLPGCSNGARQDPPDDAVVVEGVSCQEATWLVGPIDPEKQRRYSHTFSLENRTGQAIPIEQVKPDCGCIVSEDAPSEIPAHGSVGIHVSFNASPVPGDFRHAVFVKLGVTGPAGLFLKIRGSVVPTAALHASPPSLDFGRFAGTETRTRTLRISRYDFSSVGLSKLTSTVAGCALDPQPAPDGDAILVSVTLGGPILRPGSHSGTVVVDTGHPTYPSLQIPIKADIGTVADAFVSSLLIESIAPGERRDISPYRSGLPPAARPKLARLRYEGDPDIRVDPAPEGLGQDMGIWQLRVSRDADLGAVKKGVLRIGVSDRTSDDIEVPVIVFVR
jgi:Protein of unknown function (DUF1573)